MTFAVKIGRALAVMLIAGALNALACASEHEAQAVPGSAKYSQLKECVESTAFMRRNHMELIKHQRNVTVHEGVRATKHSLAGCVACHVQYDAKGKAVPVNADQQFCNRCHQWLGVQLDCFGCHSTVPEGPQPSNLMHTWPAVFAPKPVEPAKVAAPAQPEPATQPPVVIQPEPAPQPVAVQPEPAPQPVAVQPEPAPQPVVVQPEPAPQPVVVQPEPAPQPVVVQPEPAPQPPVVIQPEPAPQPVVVQPEPVVPVAPPAPAPQAGQPEGH